MIPLGATEAVLGNLWMVVCISQGNILSKDLAPVIFQPRVDTV